MYTHTRKTQTNKEHPQTQELMSSEESPSVFFGFNTLNFSPQREVISDEENKGSNCSHSGNGYDYGYGTGDDESRGFDWFKTAKIYDKNIRRESPVTTIAMSTPILRRTPSPPLLLCPQSPPPPPTTTTATTTCASFLEDNVDEFGKSDEADEDRIWKIEHKTLHTDVPFYIKISNRDEEYKVVPNTLYSSLRYILEVRIMIDVGYNIIAQLNVVEDANHDTIVTRDDNGAIIDPAICSAHMERFNGGHNCVLKVKVTENSSNRKGMKFCFKISFRSHEGNNVLMEVVSPSFIVKSRRDPKNKRTADPNVLKKPKNAGNTSKNQSSNAFMQMSSSVAWSQQGFSVPFPNSREPQHPFQQNNITQQQYKQETKSENKNYFHGTGIIGNPIGFLNQPSNSFSNNDVPASPTRVSKSELHEIMQMGDTIRNKLSKLTEKDKSVALLYLQNELFEQK
jgi:hypothetical protein